MSAPTVWSDAVWPGGQVCAVPVLGGSDGVCGMPVESEPCREHTRCVTCGHEEPDHADWIIALDAGECSARMNGEQCLCSAYTPAWQVNR